jgi:multicomponent Na+:H+ antiporter subunit B
MTSFSVILSTGARYMLPIILMFSIFLLLRGHNEPGGGFIGGLAAAAAFALFMVSYGVERAREVLRIDPMTLLGIGLLSAITSGLIPLLFGFPFLTGLWIPNNADPTEFPAIGKISTVLMFDVGVYLVVIGIVLKIVFALAEE